MRNLQVYLGLIAVALVVALIVAAAATGIITRPRECTSCSCPRTELLHVVPSTSEPSATLVWEPWRVWS
jgi:hypothetical protein